MKWFFGLLLLLLAALILDSGLLAFAAYTLLGLLLLSRVLARNWIVTLRARRTVGLRGQRSPVSEARETVDEETGDESEAVPSEAARTTHAEIGDRVVIRVTLRNSGAMPVPWVLLEDLVP